MTQTMRDAVAVVAAALVALAVVVALGALGVAAAESTGRGGPAVRPAPMRMVPDRGVRPVPGLPAPAPQKAPVAP